MVEITHKTFRGWKFFAFAMLFLFSTNILSAQKQDTLNIPAIEFITDQLENIAQTTDSKLDYSDLLDDYLYRYKNPVNLNGEAISELVELHLINEIQLNNLKAYKIKYKQFYSIYELKNIPGFDVQTIQNLLPFIKATTLNSRTKIKARNVFKYGKHRLILRYGQILEPSRGFLLQKDSAMLRPGSTYLGNPQAFYARYAFNYQNKIRIGFTLDKDAGEVFLKSQLNDSIRVQVGDKVNNLTDFFSAHMYVADLGFLKKSRCWRLPP